MDFSSYELVLYDIDGTLVDTAGAGLAALIEPRNRSSNAQMRLISSSNQ